MSRPRVLIRESIAQAGVDLLAAACEVVIDQETPLTEALAEVDAIVIRSATKMTAEVIESSPRLKVIGRAGVGVDNVDMQAATKAGIVVANAPESTIVSAAEHTLGLIMALARNVPQAHAALKEGRWERSRFGGVELAGKALAVIGFGRIGQQVARRAVALGMRVVAYDPFVAADRFRELGVEQVLTLAEALAVGDFVTLHSPLTDETRGMIDETTLAQMKPGARLINAARGALIDEAALCAALDSGQLAGAALDVYSQEPYEGPLLERDQVVVTPHLAASTAEAQDRAGVIVAEQVLAALRGELVKNAVNLPLVGAQDLELVGPYLSLGAALGRLAIGLAPSFPDRLRVAVHGPLSAADTRPLTAAVLAGLFAGRVEGPVNAVNAALLAQERGLVVAEERSERSHDYINTVVVTVRTGDEEVAVSGTTIGPEPRLFLSGALGRAIDIELGAHMVFAAYDDQPGVIGRVGTMFGEAGVNIANMAVSRTSKDGKALMAFSVDSPVSPQLQERLEREGFDDVRVYDGS